VKPAILTEVFLGYSQFHHANATLGSQEYDCLLPNNSTFIIVQQHYHQS